MFEQPCLNEKRVSFQWSHYKMSVVPFVTVASYLLAIRKQWKKRVLLIGYKVAITNPPD